MRFNLGGPKNSTQQTQQSPKIRRDPSEGPLYQIVALQVGPEGPTFLYVSLPFCQVHRSGVFQKKIVAGFLPLFLLLLCHCCIQHVTCDILLWIQIAQMCQQVSHIDSGTTKRKKITATFFICYLHELSIIQSH